MQYFLERANSTKIQLHCWVTNEFFLCVTQLTALSMSCGHQLTSENHKHANV